MALIHRKEWQVVLISESDLENPSTRDTLADAIAVHTAAATSSVFAGTTTTA